MTDDLKVPRIGRFIVGLIKRSPALALLFSFALFFSLAPGGKRLVADFTHKGFFHAHDPLLLEFEAFERKFGNDDAVVLAVHSPSGIFDVESAELLQEVTRRMWLIPEVIRVDSLANYNWVHADGDDILVDRFFPDDEPLTQALLDERKKIALAHEVLPNYLVSKDAKTAMVMGVIKPGIDRPPNSEEIVAAARKMIAEVTKGDHVIHMSGGPPVNDGFREASVRDLETLMPLVLLITIGLLWFLLRSIISILLALALVALSVVASFGFGGWVGIQITNATSILPQILLAIGVADAIHILVTYLRTYARGAERKEAVEYSLLKNFEPTFLTSLTTAAGFLSFSTADLKPISGLGILAGFGTFIAWILTYTFLGALLFLIPVKAKKVPPETTKKELERGARIADLLGKLRIPIIGGFGALSVAMLALALTNDVNSDPFKYFESHFPLRVANEFIEREVGGARGCELAIDAGVEEGVKDPEFLKKVDALQKWIETLPMVTRTVSIIDILKQTNRSLHGDEQSYYKIPDEKETVAQEIFLYTMSLPQGMNINDRITIKNDAMRVTVLWTIPTSKETTETIALIESKAKEMGLDAHVTGKNRLWQGMNQYVVESFIVSLTSAVIIISILLIIFMRSFTLGLIAMIPNGIPLFIGGGVLKLLGESLNIGTVLVMAVCLGIAVDDTIHVLSNFKRLRAEGKDRRSAVIEVYAFTSPALITTSLVLVASFGAFAFATFTPNMWFGIMVAIILTIALITDLVFLPALLLKKEDEKAT